MSDDSELPEIRAFTEAEFAIIGRVMLIWGMHEQNVGTIVSVHHKVSSESSAVLTHALGYGRKVDLACAALRSHSRLKDLATELDFVRRVFRPERDTIAHGAIGTWKEEAWVRALSKPRFVMFDDLTLLHARAEYANAISVEAVGKLQGYDSGRPRPPRPAEPLKRIPIAWRD